MDGKWAYSGISSAPDGIGRDVSFRERAVWSQKQKGGSPLLVLRARWPVVL